ncbi:MAG TPA: hypothetical protein VM940_01205 [Chthoniobacterales bacterium]|jgi:hypothetical protein|nr:hypothetical protein [Chthoniobacterales bacterium]
MLFLNRSVCFRETALCLALLVGVSSLAGSSAQAQAPPTIRLANISTRLAVGTGSNVLIGGFIITGSQPKKLLIRGLGPSLPVVANLADPLLELHDSTGALTAATDNWRDTQQDELKETTIPPRNDYESGMVQTLQPGAYTVILSGKNATVGVGLVEVYDLDETVDSKLANIATRGFVNEGDDVLIGGTIILGSGTTDVLFRAIGPSISSSATNALQDTTLDLFNGQGALVATNDNWQDSQKAEIEASTIPPSDPREAAILRSLSPGNYTAIVRGKNNTTGVGLIEAYQIR